MLSDVLLTGAGDGAEAAFSSEQDAIECRPDKATVLHRTIQVSRSQRVYYSVCMYFHE